MFDNEADSAKNEDDDYKINLSEVFRARKNIPAFQDPFSTLNRFPPNQNYNRIASMNYNNSFANSNKPSYLYSERFNSIQPINSAISLNNKKTNEHIMRKKSYNLQQQRTTIKKNLINDPFWLATTIFIF